MARNDGHRTVSGPAISGFPDSFGLPTLTSAARRTNVFLIFDLSGIALLTRYGPNSNCLRNSSPSHRCSKARRGKEAGRLQRKDDPSRVVHQLRLSATAPCSKSRLPSSVTKLTCGRSEAQGASRFHGMQHWTHRDDSHRDD